MYQIFYAESSAISPDERGMYDAGNGKRQAADQAIFECFFICDILNGGLPYENIVSSNCEREAQSPTKDFAEWFL